MDKVTYCPVCHKIAALVVHNNKSVKVVQNGRVLLNLPTGSASNTVVVKCPDKHEVVVET